MYHLKAGHRAFSCGNQLWTADPRSGFTAGERHRGGKVTPSLEVLDSPLPENDEPDQHQRILYPACVTTHSQAHRNNKVDLSDSVLMPAFFGETEVEVGSETEVETPADTGPEPVKHRFPVPAAESSSLLFTCVGDNAWGQRSG